MVSWFRSNVLVYIRNWLCSDPDRDTGCPVWFFMWSSSGSPGKFWDSISVRTTAVSLRIFSNSVDILSYDAVQSGCWQRRKAMQKEWRADKYRDIISSCFANGVPEGYYFGAKKTRDRNLTPISVKNRNNKVLISLDTQQVTLYRLSSERLRQATSWTAGARFPVGLRKFFS